MPFWNFLVNKFDGMPKWVRVLTYLTLLAVTVYLILAPRFVTGQIVVRTDSGGFLPYRGTPIQTQVAGHTLKFDTNEYGYWVIPLVDRIPSVLKLQVFHEDAHSWFPVTISALEVWTEDLRIVISEKAPFVNLEVVAVKPDQDMWLAGSLARFFVTPAQAQVALEYTKDPSVKLSPEAEQAFRVQIFEEVRKVVSDVTNLSLMDLNTITRMDSKHGFSYVTRIQVVEELESFYEIKIPDEHWRQFRTIGDFVEYIADRKNFEKAVNLPKRLSISSNWAQIQQFVGEDSKPKFMSNITAKEKRYWVVVGSHKSYEEAENQVQQINNEWQTNRAFVGIKVPPNQYFPVIVGSYIPYNEAEKLKSEAMELVAVQDAYLSPGAAQRPVLGRSLD